VRNDEREHWKTLCNLVQFDDMQAGVRARVRVSLQVTVRVRVSLQVRVSLRVRV
jgi:hypothetical protein